MTYKSTFCFSCFTMLFVSAVFLMTGCTEKEEVAPLPKGVQTLTGTVLPTDISLLRRGTHLFRIDGENTYFLESTKVSLSTYEHKQVILQGEVTKNVDASYLPVLTVESVVKVLEKTLKEWQLRSFGVVIELPDTWGGSIETDHSSFIPLGADTPVIVFRWKDASQNKGEPALDYDSVPIILDKTRATKIRDEDSGIEIVESKRPNGIMEIVFTPLDHPQLSAWYDDWNAMLTKLNLIDSASPSPTSTGATTGSPCGGSAGILCPEGFYCDVTNLQENIGICTSF